MGWLSKLEDKIKPYLGPAVGAGVTAYTGNPMLGQQVAGGIGGIQQQRADQKADERARKVGALGDFIGGFSPILPRQPPRPRPRQDRRGPNFTPYIIGGVGLLAVYFLSRRR